MNHRQVPDNHVTESTAMTVVITGASYQDIGNTVQRSWITATDNNTYRDKSYY